MTEQLDTKTRVQLALCARHMEWNPTLEELVGLITLESPDKRFYFELNDNHPAWAGEVWDKLEDDEDGTPSDSITTDVFIGEEDAVLVADGIIKSCQEWIAQRLSPSDVVSGEDEQPDQIIGDGTDTNYIALLMEIGEDEPVAWIEVLNARDGDHALAVAKRYVNEHQQEWPSADLEIVVERYFLLLPHSHTVDASDPRWEER